MGYKKFFKSYPSGLKLLKVPTAHTKKKKTEKSLCCIVGVERRFTSSL